MFDKIKDIIFRRQMAKQPKRQPVFLNYENVRSVLILFESDMMEKNFKIKEFRDELLKEEKDVVLWGYVNKKDIISPILPQSRIVGTRDFTPLGTPTEELLTDLRRREYDLLIDLTQGYCRPLHYLSLNAKARFKTGRDHIEGLHDFLIHTDAQQSPDFLFGQIIYYLKHIQSNDKA